MNTAAAITDDLWIRFLEDAIGGLREAARRIGAADLKAHYEARLGWFGKARRRQGGHRFPMEEAISHALVEVLKKMQSEQLVEGRSSFGIDLARMEFQTEVPRKIEEGIGRKSNPTDIMIAITHDDIDLRIEAKNVLKAADVSREYLGANGLGRFDNVQSPYTMKKFGAMVAYVMDLDAARWSKQITQAIWNTDPPLTILTTIIAGEALTTTSHEREIDNPLHKIKGYCRTDVVHLVLEFEASPSLRGPSVGGHPLTVSPCPM